MIVERTRVRFIDLSTAEIRGARSRAQIELMRGTEETRISDDIHIQMIQHDLRISSKWYPRPKALSMTFAFQPQQLGSRLQTPNECRVQRRQSTTVSSSSTRVVFSLLSTRSMSLFLQSINSALAKEKDNSTSSIVHRQSNQSSDKFQTVNLDTYNDHPWRVQAVQQYTHDDQNSDKIKLRVFQKIASPIIEAQKTWSSKYFKILLNKPRVLKTLKGVL